jgi:hypothetical protein
VRGSFFARGAGVPACVGVAAVAGVRESPEWLPGVEAPLQPHSTAAASAPSAIGFFPRIHPGPYQSSAEVAKELTFDR